MRLVVALTVICGGWLLLQQRGTSWTDLEELAHPTPDVIQLERVSSLAGHDAATPNGASARATPHRRRQQPEAVVADDRPPFPLPRPTAPRDYTPEYQLVFEDNFDGAHLDTHRWNVIEQGDGCGNNELEYYTSRASNAFVREGALVLKAYREAFTGPQATQPFTSGKLTTAHKADWLYGRVEARVKVPHVRGIWPAVWLLPTDNVYGGWPLSGEIDILETINDAREAHATLHFSWNMRQARWSPPSSPSSTSPGRKGGRGGGGGGAGSGTWSVGDEWHTVGVEWTPYRLSWYFDDQVYLNVSTWWVKDRDPPATGVIKTPTTPRAHDYDYDYPAPFDQRFHLILNVAVGGNWPGPPQKATPFPQEFLVDYVRVWQVAPFRYYPFTFPSSPPSGGAGDSDSDSEDGSTAESASASAVLYAAEFDNGPHGVSHVDGTAGNSQAGMTGTASVFRATDVDIAPLAPANATLTRVRSDGTAVTVRVPPTHRSSPSSSGSSSSSNPGDGGSGGAEVRRARALNTGADFFVTDWQPFEWLRYSVQVPVAGVFRLALSACASAAGARLSLAVDSHVRAAYEEVPVTAGRAQFVMVDVGLVALARGVHNLTILSHSSGWSLYAIHITRQPD